MPPITLDPHAALVVVDLQNGVLAAPFAHRLDQIIDNVNQLTAAFRVAGLPVIHFRATGAPAGRTAVSVMSGPPAADFAELHPGVRREDDLVLDKQTWGAFSNPDLLSELRARGITQVVLAGVATSIGVESTGRQAHELGFNVTFVADAMSDLSRDSHDHSITNVFPMIGETATTAAIAGELARPTR